MTLENRILVKGVSSFLMNDERHQPTCIIYMETPPKCVVIWGWLHSGIFCMPSRHSLKLITLVAARIMTWSLLRDCFRVPVQRTTIHESARSLQHLPIRSWKKFSYHPIQHNATFFEAAISTQPVALSLPSICRTRLKIPRPNRNHDCYTTR